VDYLEDRVAVAALAQQVVQEILHLQHQVKEIMVAMVPVLLIMERVAEVVPVLLEVMVQLQWRVRVELALHLQ